MIITDLGMSLPWCVDLTLQNPKLLDRSRTIHNLGSFARPQDIQCETFPQLDQSFGLADHLSAEYSCPIQETEDPITAFTRTSTPSIKAEDDSSSSGFLGTPSSNLQADDALGGEQSSVGVDILMRAIQTKSTASQPQPKSLSEACSGRRASDSSFYSSSTSGASSPRGPRGGKRYQCGVPSCGKIFTQNARLNVHSRAHTGQKPYV